MSNKYPKVPKDVAPRIIVKFPSNSGFPYHNDDDLLSYFLEKNILNWKELVSHFSGIVIKRLFTSVEPERIKELSKNYKPSGKESGPPDLLSYCVIECPYETQQEELLSILEKDKDVEEVYLESEPIPPPSTALRNPIRMSQGYLNDAPQGVDADFGKQERRRHEGLDTVRIIDIEQGWGLDHEDIIGNNINLLWGKNEEFQDHGTSVLGVLVMQDNTKGGIGIAPWANVDVISQINQSGNHAIPDAILKAVDVLKFGDILLLEIHVNTSRGSLAFWPAEIKRASFDAIKLATDKGIIVIEAAGNGENDVGLNLDDFTNRGGNRIFDPISEDFKESGAIIVAAGTDDDNHDKTDESNFGQRINCFAWGENVSTASYFPPTKTDTYDNNFNGTSSASAIIAGVAFLIQSIREASGKSRLGPEDMRRLLSDKNLGTPSRNNLIGVMPDLKKIIINELRTMP